MVPAGIPLWRRPSTLQQDMLQDLGNTVSSLGPSGEDREAAENDWDIESNSNTNDDSNREGIQPEVQSFEHFEGLPLELRVDVWKMALPFSENENPEIIDLNIDIRVSDPEFGLYFEFWHSRYNGKLSQKEVGDLGLLRACKESRQAFLQQEFPHKFPTTIVYGVARFRDQTRIYLSNYKRLFMYNRDLSISLSHGCRLQSSFALIRHLTLPYMQDLQVFNIANFRIAGMLEIQDWGASRDQGLYRMILLFHNLETLGFKVGSPQPKTFLKLGLLEIEVIHGLTQNILAILKYRASGLEGWKAPKVYCCR